MSETGLRDDHPVDALPDYVRGGVADPAELEAHLAECEACRVEVEVLRALEDSDPAPLSDVERRRVYHGFEKRRAAGGAPRRPAFVAPSGGPTTVGPRWLTATWRAAATIALLLTGIGVWQVVQRGETATDWSPELALEGWGRDLAELDVEPNAVRMAFGLESEVAWEDLDVDPFDLATPWEEN
ncbi:MAG: zf-HC2 domain-containing protein [Gemmatimonadetes bacterium]|nr:zf-HC2 domain-containing protein [Gemmatimonadota bacterium]